MDITGYTLHHKTLGDGVVLSMSGKYMTVKFSDKQKTFVYPDAFDSFLSITDEEANRVISADLARAKSTRAAEEDRRRTEREEQMRSWIVIPGAKSAEPSEAEVPDDGDDA